MFERIKELWKPNRRNKKLTRFKDSEINSSVNEVAPRSGTSEETYDKNDKNSCTKDDKVSLEESTLSLYDADNSENEVEQSISVFCSEVKSCKNNNELNDLQQELELYHREHCTALKEVDCLPNLRRERVIGILNSHYPPTDFYDFCVIASENDYELGQRFVDMLRNQGLCGRLAGSRLGDDIFQEHEVLMNSSTKIMFLITEYFTADRFCRRLQSAAVFQSLLARISLERDKCVPVFIEASGRLAPRIPLPLIGVAGLNLSEPRAIVQRIKGTYTTEVKRTKVVRALNYLEEREDFCKRLLSDDSFDLLLDDHLTSRSSIRSMISDGRVIGKDERLISGVTAGGTVSKCSESVSSVKNIVSGVESLISDLGISAKEDSGQEFTLCDEQVQQYVNVEGSSDVHVGPQINLIVNVHNGPVTNIATDSE